MGNKAMKTLTLGDTIYEITDESARNNIKTLQNSIESINNSTTGSVGQVVSIASVDSNGKPNSFKGTCSGYLGCAKGTAEELPLTGNGNFDQIILKTWSYRNNNIMSFSNDGGIKCPVAGAIKIWGSVELNTVNTDETAGVYIFKNEEEVAGCYGLGNRLSNVFAVIEVSAGDIIFLKARNSTERTNRIAYPKSKSTFLCIEYI